MNLHGALLGALAVASACKAPAAPPHLDAGIPSVRADAPADASPSDASPTGRPWLEVHLPGPPAAGAPAAKAIVGLHESKVVASEYEGVRLSVDGAAPRDVRLGEQVELTIPASADGRLTFRVHQMAVIAPIRPGDTLRVIDEHDGGWVAQVEDRQTYNAPKSVTKCLIKKNGECPAFYGSELLQSEDSVCPTRGEITFKCVLAPRVRLRGKVEGKAEVNEASESARFDDLGTVPLSAKWTAVAIGGERMPLVTIGEASAYVLMGPGEDWEVWKSADGRVEAALVKSPAQGR
jgi:hypothetical protein